MRNGPLLAREGWPFLALSVLASLLATWWWGGWSWPLWLVTLFMVQFFRDPSRPVPPEKNGQGRVFSPADGRIVAVAVTEDPWQQRSALKISVFMNVFNVHANRSPVAGRVEKTWYHPGSFLNAAIDKASTENERAAILIRTPDGQMVLSVQIAGLIARRILCYAKEGDQLQCAERYGFIRFGSRVDVYLDPASTPQVAPGQRVQAGITILATLPGTPLTRVAIDGP